ncbi:hypothetical protein PGT21_009251 [Puccinia graminis f. sp. tritici]|uniref:Uncharacterized protein n=1 Tax=Puccinia graminis f. sp. tritici TaxID=56615 RepID=A0A5B0N3Y7_PUCGR|nr:hypothetical protein PGT21_009251 [Puccinia graminis f. sp. tritici]
MQSLWKTNREVQPAQKKGSLEDREPPGLRDRIVSKTGSLLAFETVQSRTTGGIPPGLRDRTVSEDGRDSSRPSRLLHSQRPGDALPVFEA